MSLVITLTLPDALYEPLRRTARATNQPMESVVLTALQSSLPALDGLSPELLRQLSELEGWTNEELWHAMLERVPEDQQEELENLLHQNQAGQLQVPEAERLDALQHAADVVMLRKARAAVLLRLRGQRLPTLAELRHLTRAAG
ncbi:MAG: hypothetical protein HY784_15790 [Chloroflexi bacterium]|nr:hypothetical protein [Chloroflexota bacterium]